MQYTINNKKLPKARELSHLFAQTSWAKSRSLEGVEKLLQKTEVFVVVRDTDTEQLIGFGRALSDGIYRAMLDDIVIDESYRKRGLGKRIVHELLDQVQDVEQVFLNTKPELEVFYNEFGFTKTKAFTMSL
ncbi:GNAT family N-acetyltransferase [uncultured Aquimarina sp.]|uniref:GNAT family N-acetyltransferase n=1 Tax=uncultured Aquimarina sp. TaxID=575652 RepID=UPI00260633B5|nr:GNAT family N-acetyltransferase [uncultured Aquimarina sp.]